MKKSVLLMIFAVISVVLMILAAAYLFGVVSEQGLSEREKNTNQALSLAEAGLNHGIDELRTMATVDLNNDPLIQNAAAATFQQYLGAAGVKDSLDFLCDFLNFAYPVGVNDEVRFAVAPLDLTANIAGANYSANIVIRKRKDCCGKDIEALEGKIIEYDENKCELKCNPEPDGCKIVDHGSEVCETKGSLVKPESGVFAFPYEFRIEAQGQVNYTGKTGTITKNLFFSAGKFTITIQRGNFARYALFTSHHTTPSGGRVWFTERTKFYGPVHTNDQLSFANNPYFSDAVTQHLNKAYFYNQGWPRQLDQDSNPPYDVPQFDAEFTRGVGLLNLPSSVTQQDLKQQATGGQNDGPWSSGTYLPYDIPSGRTKTECETNADGLKCPLAGGIYIKGNANNLTMGVDVNNRPVYIITQETNTKKITIDYAANGGIGETVVANVSGSGGTAPATYTGVPNGTSDKGIIIYDNGSISNFSGKVQSDTQVTVSSDSDIVINPNPAIDNDNKIYGIDTDKHIRYQSYTPDDPVTPGNELSAKNYTNLLGILSWNGDVRIGTGTPNNPLDIHAVVMAAGRSGVFTVDNYNSGSPRGNVNLLGGAITDFYGPFGTFSGTSQVSGYGRNFVYDGRMKDIAPPYFPTLSFFVVSAPELAKPVNDMGLNWQEQ
ncbi:MAG: DUF4900 domain-containing protein [Candidatus Omnitrophota bacterium]|nr:DUF4900 domain-containing protein [Candidatus Omnitrophota bacterium]